MRCVPLGCAAPALPPHLLWIQKGGQSGQGAGREGSGGNSKLAVRKNHHNSAGFQIDQMPESRGNDSGAGSGAETWAGKGHGRS